MRPSIRVPLVRTFVKTLLSAAKEWSADNAFKHSSSVAFSMLFSLAPVTVIAAAIAGTFLGRDKAGDALLKQMTGLIGEDSAKMIQEVSDRAASATQGNWMTTVVGVAILIFGATTVFGQLQESLNDIWNVRQKPSRAGWPVLISQRLISFAMVLTVGFLLLVSLVLTTALEGLTSHFASDNNAAVLKLADASISLVVITALFALLLKMMPDVKVRWSEVWKSGFITALLFTLGRYGISFYLSHSTVASIYGAAGSLVALLVWIYYSCAIFFYGAELVKAERKLNGLPVEPKKTAVVVQEILQSESR